MRRRWVVSPDYRSAIAAIKHARTEQGMSQRELAARLNKPPSFINKIELLERRLDVLEFVALAHALDLSPGQLLERVTAALPAKIEL